VIEGVAVGPASRANAAKNICACVVESILPV